MRAPAHVRAFIATSGLALGGLMACASTIEGSRHPPQSFSPP
jgi:hypothetical protein